jgi:hypothetical protein
LYKKAMLLVGNAQSVPEWGNTFQGDLQQAFAANEGRKLFGQRFTAEWPKAGA